MTSDDSRTPGNDAGETTGPRVGVAEVASPADERIARLITRSLAVPISLLVHVAVDSVAVIAAHSGVSAPKRLLCSSPELIDQMLDRSGMLLLCDEPCSRVALTLSEIAGAEVRAALGVPVASAGDAGYRMLLALDTRPHYWSADERNALEDLAALLQPHAGSAAYLQPDRNADLLLESIGEGVYSIDQQGMCRYINRTGASMLGYEPEEILGRSMHDLVHHSYPDGTPMPKCDCPTVAAIHSGAHTNVSSQIFWRKDGTQIPVEITVSPIRERGEVTGTVINFADNTALKEAEDDLRFHKHIVDAVGQAVIANDNSPERRITYWNKAAERLLGWTAEEALGRGFYETVPVEDFWPDVRAIGKLARQGEPWQGEFRVSHRNGSIIPAIASVAPILDNDGELIGVISVYTDAREIKNNEREIRLYKHMVDSVGQALVANTPDRTITYWNDAAEQMLGWKAEEVLGRDFYEVAPADDVSEWMSEIGAQVRNGQNWSGEFRLKRKDGSTVPVLMSVSPVIDDAGTPVQIVGAYTDISELKETEREIRFYKHVVEAVGQVIIANDLDRNVTYWNKTAEEVLGWKPEEVVGKDAASIAPAGEFLPNIPAITRVVRSGRTWTGEFLMQHRDGSTIPALSTIKPIFDEADNLIGVLGAHTDIRELKATEQELRIHKDMLDAVGQAVLATDEALRINYWNRAAEELFGYKPGEALGMHLRDLIPRGSEGFYRAIDSGDPLVQEAGWTGEIISYDRNGGELTVLASAKPVLNDEGARVGLIVAMADITQRRRIEEALRTSNQQIIEILETMGDGFLAVDRHWQITYINKQGERSLSRDREMVLGQNVWEQFPGADQRAFFKQYSHALASGESVDFTEYYPELGAWFEVHAFPSGDQLSIFFRDVTERITQEHALRDAEQRYRTLVEQLPAVTYTASPDDVSIIQYVSPQVKSLLGFSPDEWLEDPWFWLSLLHPDDHHIVLREDQVTNASRDSFTLEYRLQSRDGAYHWIRDSATLIRDDGGTPLYWQGLSYDISDEKAAERQIHESEQRFRSLFQHNPDAVFSIDGDGRVLTANPAFIQLTGRDPRAGDGLRFVDLVVPEDRDRVATWFTRTHKGESQAFHASILNRRGERTALSITTIPIIVDGEIVGVHVVVQDVTLNQELENQLAHQAYHDSLTGLPNRNLFQSRLEARLDRASLTPGLFAVLFFDLDDFKVINDSLGHSAGDQLLIQVAGRVQTCIRDNDLLARLGGDEFTLLLERIGDEREAVAIAERIAQVLEESFVIDGHEVFVTTSIGIALADRSSEHADDVLRNADMAMYEAKNAGKNRYAIFESSMKVRAWLRLTLETELRRALERDEFEVYYQPIVDLQTGDLDGFEALVRWNHPTRGLLTPQEFISVAEQSGLIVPLGRQVVTRALCQLERWQAMHPDHAPLRLSINLSSRQYQHPRMVEELSSLIEQANVDPGLVTMEITESIAMDDSDAAIKTLQRLKEIGVHLALDDFGTGFSALSYLRRFPIDMIKIDQSFVEGLDTDPEDTSIVEAVMAASLAMHLRVTAEGIESVEQLARLRELGCHLGQGYLFCEPLSADAMYQVLFPGTLPWREQVFDLADHPSP